MTKKKIKGLSKAPKTKKQTTVQTNTSSTNPTRMIIDALKEKYEFRLNKGNQKMEFHRQGEVNFRDLGDTDFNSIKVELNLNDIPCSKETLRGILYSDQWPQYDPYSEFLNSLPQWDGKDHIGELAATVKTKNDNYWVWCLRKWLVGFVGSLAKEDVVNQIAIIFCGKQGAGKSTWLRNLLPPELKKYSSSGFLDPRDKETLIQLSELCLYIMDEVENLKPKNVEAIKELITKTLIYLRRAYTTLSQNYVRRCSFCGTANGTNILHDISGNRRFLCHEVVSLDYQLKNIDLYQVYAQALYLFSTGFQFWLDANEQAAVEKQNSQFRAKSIEEELIDTYLEPCNDGDNGSLRMQAHEIQTFLQTKYLHSKLSPIVIGKVLSSKGYCQKKSVGISKWVVRKKVVV
jgi:predicted P-loop ATPase